MLEPKLNELDGEDDEDDDPLIVEEGILEKEALELGDDVIDEPGNEVLGMEEALPDGELLMELPEGPAVLLAAALLKLKDELFLLEGAEELELELELTPLPEFALPEVLPELDAETAVLLVIE